MMGRHSKPETEALAVSVPESAHDGMRPEPVAIAAAAQAVLAAAVTIGWVTLDDTTIATIATAIAAVASLMFTLFARSKVTPISNPKL